MTVEQLIKALQKEDPKRIVVMAKDAEGNGYSPVSSFWTGAYRADSTWSGEVGLEKLTPADKKQGYSEDDVIDDGKPCVVLCPVN